jgi:hypothetical protein
MARTTTGPNAINPDKERKNRRALQAKMQSVAAASKKRRKDKQLGGGAQAAGR